MGSRQEALAAYRRALAIREDLAAAEPANARLQEGMAQIHERIAYTFEELARLDEASRSMERALAIREVLVRDHPGNATYMWNMASCQFNLGAYQGQAGHPDEAIRLQERALAARMDLVRLNPNLPRRQSDVAQSQSELGNWYEAVGRMDDAMRSTGLAAAALEALVRAHPENESYRDRLASSLFYLGILLRRAAKPGAELPIERSVTIREALLRDRPTSASYQFKLITGYLILATLRAAAGRPDEALLNIRKAERIVERSAGVHPHTHYNLACAYAQYSAAAGPGGGDLTPAERSERQAYSDRAMAYLRRAVTTEYRGLVELMSRDVDLDPLRPRRDFQELLLDLSFPTDPFQR
jgi:tetratricopeptide (TPR) repeat protein